MKDFVDHGKEHTRWILIVLGEWGKGGTGFFMGFLWRGSGSFEVVEN